MAFQAELAAGLALFPGVMAFGTFDLQSFGVLFVGECHLPERGIEGDLIFCSKYAADHQHGEYEANKNTYT